MRKESSQNKKVFFIYTCGRVSAAHTNDIRKIAEETHAEILGEYGCVGFDTFGPLKLIGGMRKGHPNAEEVRGAVKFYQGIVRAQEESEKTENRCTCLQSGIVKRIINIKRSGSYPLIQSSILAAIRTMEELEFVNSSRKSCSDV